MFPEAGQGLPDPCPEAGFLMKTCRMVETCGDFAFKTHLKHVMWMPQGSALRHLGTKWHVRRDKIRYLDLKQKGKKILETCKELCKEHHSKNRTLPRTWPMTLSFPLVETLVPASLLPNRSTACSQNAILWHGKGSGSFELLYSYLFICIHIYLCVFICMYFICTHTISYVFTVYFCIFGWVHVSSTAWIIMHFPRWAFVTPHQVLSPSNKNPRHLMSTHTDMRWESGGSTWHEHFDSLDCIGHLLAFPTTQIYPDQEMSRRLSEQVTWWAPYGPLF